LRAMRYGYMRFELQLHAHMVPAWIGPVVQLGLRRELLSCPRPYCTLRGVLDWLVGRRRCS
jgi:hypothetical protein